MDHILCTRKVSLGFLTDWQLSNLHKTAHTWSGRTSSISAYQSLEYVTGKSSPAFKIPIPNTISSLQEIAYQYNHDNVLAGEKREYGYARVNIEKHKGEAIHVDKLFNGLGSEMDVYMSHGMRNINSKQKRQLTYV